MPKTPRAPLSFEEHIIRLRYKYLPGPVRRFLGIFLAALVFPTSIALWLLLTFPTWILTASIWTLSDRSYIGDYEGQKQFETVPLLRGTFSLFCSAEDEKFYREIRLGERIEN